MRGLLAKGSGGHWIGLVFGLWAAVPSMADTVEVNAVAVNAVPVETVQPPNIIVILADDLGYAELGCYGQTLIETPNIDALAEEGIRFTHFYTPAGVCSATRSSIITGMMQTSINAHNHRSARARFEVSVGGACQPF